MYTYLLKEILFDMKDEYQAKDKLVEYCRIQYADNEFQLGLIDQFDLEYNGQLAIQWYKKESFLYSMMNGALRMQDIETIVQTGFFVHDIHKQIVEMYNKQMHEHKEMTIYRGQVISLDELSRLQKSIGGLISFNLRCKSNCRNLEASFLG